MYKVKKTGVGTRSEHNLEFTVTEGLEVFHFLNKCFNCRIVPYEDNYSSKRPER